MTAILEGKAGRADLMIEQGTCFNLPVWWKDQNEVAIDLTDWTARLQIRDVYGQTLLHEFTTENGGITIEPLDGKLTITMSKEDTDALDWHSGKYDLEMIDGLDCVMRLLFGNVSVSPQVTR